MFNSAVYSEEKKAMQSKYGAIHNKGVDNIRAGISMC